MPGSLYRFYKDFPSSSISFSLTAREQLRGPGCGILSQRKARPAWLFVLNSTGAHCHSFCAGEAVRALPANGQGTAAGSLCSPPALSSPELTISQPCLLYVSPLSPPSQPHPTPNLYFNYLVPPLRTETPMILAEARKGCLLPSNVSPCSLPLSCVHLFSDAG